MKLPKTPRYPTMRVFRLGQPVIVVPFMASGGWTDLEDRLKNYPPDVEVSSNTAGVIVRIESVPIASADAVPHSIYQVLWSTEKLSWHHSSLILELTEDWANHLSTFIKEKSKNKP